MCAGTLGASIPGCIELPLSHTRSPIASTAVSLKRRRQAWPCGVSANWHGKMLILPFPAPACPHTAPTLAGDCGKSTLPGIRLKPVRADLPQTPGRIKTTALPGAQSTGCLSSPFLRPPPPRPFCSLVRHRAENLEARSKTAPASPLCPFATVTVLAFADC